MVDPPGPLHVDTMATCWPMIPPTSNPITLSNFVIVCTCCFWLLSHSDAPETENGKKRLFFFVFKVDKQLWISLIFLKTKICLFLMINFTIFACLVFRFANDNESQLPRAIPIFFLRVCAIDWTFLFWFTFFAATIGQHLKDYTGRYHWDREVSCSTTTQVMARLINQTHERSVHNCRLKPRTHVILDFDFAVFTWAEQRRTCLAVSNQPEAEDIPLCRCWCLYQCRRSCSTTTVRQGRPLMTPFFLFFFLNVWFVEGPDFPPPAGTLLVVWMIAAESFNLYATKNWKANRQRNDR